MNVVRGRARAASDFDVGIIPIDLQLSLHDELALASALSAAVSAEIDLVRLDDDEPVLGAEVARTGICLFEAAPGSLPRIAPPRFLGGATSRAR